MAAGAMATPVPGARPEVDYLLNHLVLNAKHEFRNRQLAAQLAEQLATQRSTACNTAQLATQHSLQRSAACNAEFSAAHNLEKLIRWLI